MDKWERIVITAIVLILLLAGAYRLGHDPHTYDPTEVNITFQIVDERDGYEKTRDILNEQSHEPLGKNAFIPFIPDEYKWIEIKIHYKTYGSSDWINSHLDITTKNHNCGLYITAPKDERIDPFTEGTLDYWYLIPQPAEYKTTGTELIPWEEVTLDNLEFIVKWSDR